MQDQVSCLFSGEVDYTANGVNCDILITNSKLQIPRLKFQILPFKSFLTLIIFSFSLGIWDLVLGTWIFKMYGFIPFKV